MVQINFASREVNCKIVFYGPGRSGKTTNLEVVHAKAPKDSIGELISIATETDRTLYFDFLPLDLGQIAGMTTKFQLYTVPGQVFYNATRKLVLQGADGVIFVADSHPDMMQENLESLQNLEENLQENGINIDEVALCLQYNKRDLPNAMPVEELDAVLNRWGCATQEAVAVRGEGVFPTLKSISSQVIKKLNEEQGFSADGKSRLPTGPPTGPKKAPPAAAPQAAPAAQAAAQGAAAPARPAAPQRPAPAAPAAPAAPPRPAPAANANVLAQEIQRRKQREEESKRMKAEPAGTKTAKKKGGKGAMIFVILLVIALLAVGALVVMGVIDPKDFGL